MSGRPSGDLGVGSWIERWARVAPERPALVVGDDVVSYAAFAARIRRLATGLRGIDVGRGDRVAWVGPNHVAFLELLFACGRIGAVLAPVNHRLAAAVRAAVLRDTAPVVLVEHAMAEPTDAPTARHRVRVGEATVAPDPIAETQPPALAFEALAAAADDAPLDGPVGLGDLCMLPHTSGTTGLPKGVMLTHGNVTWNAIDFATTASLRADDVTIAIAPFFRVGGTGVNVLPTLFAGGTVVIPDDAAPDDILRAMERHGVSIGFANPDLLAALAAAPAWHEVDLSAVRHIVTGGAPVPERLIRTFLERGLTLLQGYGLSEAAPFVLLLDPSLALAKVGAAGRPALFVDVRVTDDDGQPVPVGAAGELRVRGPNVMAGYWQRPDDTARTLVDGWLRTGDAARMDADGDIWIVDRLDARFLTAGGLVYPGDVERVLLDHPMVDDVGVVGVATEGPEGIDMTGAAFVVPRAGVDVDPGALLTHARARLAPFAVPATVTIVDALPRNAVGKLIRADLAALATRTVAPRRESAQGS